MSRSTKAKRKKGNHMKRYYDSCTIENTSTYENILKQQKDFKNESFISHLCIGEAVGNIFHKKGYKAVSDFVELYSRMVKVGLKVIGNDGIKEILNEVSEKFPELSVTDSIHLATSIKWKCNNLITSDHDLCDLDKGKVRKLGKDFGISSLKIKKVDYE